MKKSIEDLNESKEFQRPANRARKGVLLTELSSDFAEVYSPPRVTKLASDMRLKSAWALDLITIDPLDGKPWNFNVKAMRDRAVKLLDRDRPLLLIACPICGPFASINTNYDKVDSQDVKDTLEAAMRHLKFALERVSNSVVQAGCSCTNTRHRPAHGAQRWSSR